MTKAERAALREGCDEPYLYIGKLIAALDEKDALIADALSLAYQAIAYEMDSDDAHEQLAALKARAEK